MHLSDRNIHPNVTQITHHNSLLSMYPTTRCCMFVLFKWGVGGKIRGQIMCQQCFISFFHLAPNNFWICWQITSKFIKAVKISVKFPCVAVSWESLQGPPHQVIWGERPPRELACCWKQEKPYPSQEGSLVRNSQSAVRTYPAGYIERLKEQPFCLHTSSSAGKNFAELQAVPYPLLHLPQSPQITLSFRSVCTYLKKDLFTQTYLPISIPGSRPVSITSSPIFLSLEFWYFLWVYIWMHCCLF